MCYGRKVDTQIWEKYGKIQIGLPCNIKYLSLHIKWHAKLVQTTNDEEVFFIYLLLLFIYFHVFIYIYISTYFIYNTLYSTLLWMNISNNEHNTTVTKKEEV